VSEVAAAAPIAFVVGAVVGFLAANRYRLIRLNDRQAVRQGPADWDSQPKSDEMMDEGALSRAWLAGDKADKERERKRQRRGD
jgi:hypothetical protein